MSDLDALADWLGARDYARNLRDYTDEERTAVDIDVETLARDILASDWLAGERERAWNEGGLAELNAWAPTHDFAPFRMRMRNPYRRTTTDDLPLIWCADCGSSHPSQEEFESHFRAEHQPTSDATPTDACAVCGHGFHGEAACRSGCGCPEPDDAAPREGR